MAGFFYLIAFIIGLVLLVLLFRAIGAWMLRIDEVIVLLRDIKEILKKQ